MLTRTHPLYTRGSNSTPQEILATFGVDIDRGAGWIGCYGGPDHRLISGVWAAEVGSLRVIKPFRKCKPVHQFVPGHSIETFSVQGRKVADAGHEIGAPGCSLELSQIQVEVSDEGTKFCS